MLDTTATKTNARTAVVTGAFGYSGRHIAKRLVDQGLHVRTLTNHAPESRALGETIEVSPLDFGDIGRLRASLMGADVVYNTYWVRFPNGAQGHDIAVKNTKILMEAASAEGVSHFVHISVANADQAPQLTYYRGKAELETYLRDAGLPFTIVRPTVIYGNGDILINNIAWFLRHVPVFGIPGDGTYGIQPVFIEDYADLVVGIGEAPATGLTIDAVGPDAYTFADLVGMIRQAVQSRSMVINVPPQVAWLATSIVSAFARDVVLTQPEIEALTAGLLVSRGQHTCPTRFDEWLANRPDDLGGRYASELARRRPRGLIRP